MDEKQFKEWLKNKLNIDAQNLSLYQRALTTIQYEILEFLGDAVLEYIVSDILVKGNQDQSATPESLTAKRSSLVDKKNLSSIGEKLGLKDMAIIPETSNRSHVTDNVLEDMVEALIGAVYLDLGLQKAREVTCLLLGLQEVDEDENKSFSIQDPVACLKNHFKQIQDFEQDPISTLQIGLQKQAFSPPSYVEKEKTGSPHNPHFIMEVSCKIGNKVWKAEGHGNNKKEAKKKSGLESFVAISTVRENDGECRKYTR